MKDPLFILGCHKSGTSLLRALLDGHPDLWVIPKEAHPLAAAGLSVPYPLRPQEGEPLSQQYREETFRAFLEQEAREQSPTSDHPEFEFNLDRFKNAFPQALKNVESPLKAYLLAFGSMCGLPEATSEQLPVEKSVEHVCMRDSLLREFPSSKFLLILRNPAATLVAVRKSRQLKYFPYLHPILAAIRASFETASQLEAHQNSCIVRYEDLIQSPEREMRKISKWLGLAYHDSLCVPTAAGVLWKGNSTSHLSFSGLDPRPLDAWQKEITRLETWILQHFPAELFMPYGYKPVFPVGFPWRPESGEGFSLYLRHRVGALY